MPDTPKPGSQKDLVLTHLKRSHSLTPLQAIGLYSIYRLAAVVHRLRGDGWEIKTIDRRDPKSHPYAEYYLNREDAAPA